MEDAVNSPKHYMLMEGVEVINVVDVLCDKAAANNSLIGAEISYYAQMMQYLMRFMDKNGEEDLKKAKWYLDRLVASRTKGKVLL